MPITTKVGSSSPVHGQVYSIQHYMIKFVSDLWQFCGSLWFPPPIKLTSDNITEILLKVVLNTINKQTNKIKFFHPTTSMRKRIANRNKKNIWLAAIWNSFILICILTLLPCHDMQTKFNVLTSHRQTIFQDLYL